MTPERAQRGRYERHAGERIYARRYDFPMRPGDDDAAIVRPAWVDELADSFRNGTSRRDLSTENFPHLAAAAGVGRDEVALHAWTRSAATDFVPDSAKLTKPERVLIRAHLRAALAWLEVDPYVLTAEAWDSAIEQKKPPQDGPVARKAWARANELYARERGEADAFADPTAPPWRPGEFKAAEDYLDSYRDCLITAIAAELGQTVVMPAPWREIRDGRGQAAASPSPKLPVAQPVDTVAPEELGAVADGAPLRPSGAASPEPRSRRRRRYWTVGIGGAAAIAVTIAGTALGGVPETPAAADIGELTQMPPLDAVSQQVAPAGWWPERDTISVASPPLEPTLNSFVDSEPHGFEPNFMQVKLHDADDSTYTDDLLVQPGDVFTALVYFNNDSQEAATENTRLRIVMPGVITGSTNAYAVLSADNAVVPEVEDGVSIVVADAAGEEVALRYVTNTAVIHSGGAVDGQSLGDALFTGGVPVGCASLDGTLPGGAGCSGYVTFDVRVDQPGFDVVVKASSGTTAEPSEVIEVASGQEIEVHASYQNTGSNQQDNVLMRLRELPGGISYVPNSTSIMNSTTGGEFEPHEEGLATTGLNLGSYQPQGNVSVVFRLRVSAAALDRAAEEQLDLSTFIRVTTAAGYKESGVILATTPGAAARAIAKLEADQTDGFWRAGWGPQRELVTSAELSPFPVFNSVEDDPVVGDERDFVGVAKDTGSGADPEASPTWYNDVWVAAGETYIMRVDVHNGGSLENAGVPAGSLQDARLRVGITESDGVSSVFGYLSAENAGSVWDGVSFHHDEGVQIAFDATTADQYVYGTSEDGASSGYTLQKLGAQAFSSEGTLLGRKLDGVIPPGAGSTEAIYFKIRVLAGAPAPTVEDGVLWGPVDRNTFTTASGGAPYPVFNAITDNPNYGDERNFLTTKSSKHKSAGGWVDDVWVNPGEIFLLRAFGNNSGQDSAGSVPAGSLHDARIRLSITEEPRGHVIKAELLAANAEPIWDSVVVHAAEGATVQFDSDSFEITNNAHTGGVVLHGDPFSDEGAKIGYKDQDGVLAPGYAFDFFVTGAFSVVK